LPCQPSKCGFPAREKECLTREPLLSLAFPFKY
jgi:hypothetical protein